MVKEKTVNNSGCLFIAMPFIFLLGSLLIFGPENREAAIYGLFIAIIVMFALIPLIHRESNEIEEHLIEGGKLRGPRYRHLNEKIERLEQKIQEMEQENKQ